MPSLCLARRVLHAVASSFLPLALAAQGTPPAEVVQAQGMLSRSQLDSAIATLETFVTRTPAAGGARLILGDALHRKGQHDRALAAYAGVRAPNAAVLQARIRSAIVEAQRGRTEEAFAFLAQVKQVGSFDMDLLVDSSAFASLRRDSRLEGLRFRPAEFDPPFVEPVRIIQEWRGAVKNDQFGWIARSIGDVNGDHVSDVVTSAPGHGTTATVRGSGRVYVYSGRNGALLWQMTGDSAEALGSGLEGAGDVNGDGVGDVIAGAPGRNRARVYSGRDGRVLHTFAGDTAGEGFGRSSASAGDQDADGIADLIVGAPGANVAGAGAGRVYVFSGRTGQRLFVIEGERAGDAFGSIVAGVKDGRGTPLLVGAPGAGALQRGRAYSFGRDRTKPMFIIDSDSTGGALGAMFTSVVGDVDGDRVGDVYAADFANSASGPATGRIYVHSGADGRRIRTITGTTAGEGFGIGSADVGDVNRDGYDDLLLGAWQHASVASSGGKIYLYSGKDGTQLRAITGRVAGETLGFDAAGVGDVDGDGTLDFLVTSAWSNINGFRSGRMYIISGK